MGQTKIGNYFKWHISCLISRYQTKFGSINQILESTQRTMCIQTPSYYRVIAAVIDIAMFFIYGGICFKILPPGDNCSHSDVIHTLAMIALVYFFGVHLLELIIQCWINNTQDPDPKSFYAGIVFTFLHMIKFVLVCALILPNLNDAQQACGVIITVFSAFYVVAAFSVVVLRVTGLIRHWINITH